MEAATSRPTLPSYDELPVRPGAPAGSSWGLWGDDDRLGCLNLLTEERVLAGVRAIQTGERFPLDLPLHWPDPPLFGRARFEHHVDAMGDPEHPTGHDDSLSSWNTQSSSQWDGFLHIGHPQHGFYNGLPISGHGMSWWAERGIAGRAVLCDLTRVRDIDHSTNDQVQPEEVHAALESQGVEVEPGDVLLLHFGWVRWYRGLDDASRAALATPELRAPGLAPGDRTCRALWDLHIAAVASDVPALEVWPPGSLLSPEEMAAHAAAGEMHEIFTHFSLLPLLGLPIGELWDLDRLAAACNEDGRWTCLLTSSPIHTEGGVASPPNAMAIR